MSNKKLREEFDDIDLGIISLLQRDSRLSFNKIASELGISTGTAYNRVKILEERNILIGYSAIIDSLKLGFNMTAIVLIQAEGTHLAEVEKEIAAKEGVVSVYDITGDYDVAVLIRFKDTNGLNRFVKNLLATPHIKRTVTNVVLNVIKEDFRMKLL